MSLEKWVEYGWLRQEPTSPGEIRDLLGIVDRSLADSRVEAVSADLRFIAAFGAALTVATTALRASGHRTATQAGHHVKTIESTHRKSESQTHPEAQDIQQQEEQVELRRGWSSIGPRSGGNDKAGQRTEG